MKDNVPPPPVYRPPHRRHEGFGAWLAGTGFAICLVIFMVMSLVKIGLVWFS